MTTSTNTHLITMSQYINGFNCYTTELYYKVTGESKLIIERIDKSSINGSFIAYNKIKIQIDERFDTESEMVLDFLLDFLSTPGNFKETPSYVKSEILSKEEFLLFCKPTNL